MPTTSEVIAIFAAGLSYTDLPAGVVNKCKLHVLDLLGVALASSSMSFADQALRAALAGGGGGVASVIGNNQRLPPSWAALVNGTMGHGLDFDDTHQGSVVHVSASVVPAALAAGEAADVSGERFLTALVLGMESAVRIGLVAAGGFHDRGFHPTGICGTYASALAAGSLARLDSPQLANALGLCGSMAAGSLEFLTDGSWAKRLHAGWAAHGGLIAAALAGQGFSGPRSVFEGRFGLFRSHLGESGWNLDRLTSDLGERWEMLDIALKPYPCCHYNHAFIDCASSLRTTSGLSPDSIEGIECWIEPRQMPIVCEPQATKRVPQNDYDAKFSLPYSVACMLVRGHVDIDDFTDEAIHDARVLQLAQRIVCIPAPAEHFPRRFPGRLRITLRNGRTVEHSEAINRGSTELPLSEDEVCAKFRLNARRRLSTAAVENVIDNVFTLESAPRLGPLAHGLSAS